MSKLLTVSLLLGFLLAPTASAVTTVAEGDLLRIYLYKPHTGVLIKHANLIDPESCGSGNYFIHEETHPHLLAAFMAERQVGLTFAGCRQSYPAIQYVYVTP